MRGFTAKLYVDPNATPKFFSARSVPYALREQELDRVLQDGVLEPVEFSEWADPIVVVVKRDKRAAKLKNGKFFSKLDLNHAYQQLPLEEDSKRFVIINTGIASAPAIFQRVIEGLLQGIEGVVTYLDDILISGSSEEEHLVALEEVLSRLEKAGLRVRSKKCEFMRTSVMYLSDELGLKPIPHKMEAIQDAPIPESVSKLKSYLGTLSYYGKFMANLSAMLQPLYALLRKDAPWKWGTEQQQSFQASKDLLTSEAFLTHFDLVFH